MTPSMNTYWGILWKMVDMADIVVQVVDARFPSICRSNRLEDKVREMENKNLLVVLNKTDLISREKLNQWIKWFADSEGIKSSWSICQGETWYIKDKTRDIKIN